MLRIKTLWCNVTLAYCTILSNKLKLAIWRKILPLLLRQACSWKSEFTEYSFAKKSSTWFLNTFKMYQKLFCQYIRWTNINDNQCRPKVAGAPGHILGGGPRPRPHFQTISLPFPSRSSPSHGPTLPSFPFPSLPSPLPPRPPSLSSFPPFFSLPLPSPPIP